MTEFEKRCAEACLVKEIARLELRIKAMLGDEEAVHIGAREAVRALMQCEALESQCKVLLGNEVRVAELEQERDSLKAQVEGLVIRNALQESMLTQQSQEIETLRQVLTNSLAEMAKFEARALARNRYRQPLSLALDMRGMIDRILEALKTKPEAIRAAMEGK